VSSGVISTPGSAEFAKATPDFLLMIGFGISDQFIELDKAQLSIAL
jgi:hypothetical protein